MDSESEGRTSLCRVGDRIGSVRDSHLDVQDSGLCCCMLVLEGLRTAPDSPS